MVYRFICIRWNGEIALKKPIPKLSHQLVGFVFRDTAESEAAKLSSLKLQSLFDKAADRIEKMKQLHGNDFDKKINLQASLSYSDSIYGSFLCDFKWMKIVFA